MPLFVDGNGRAYEVPEPPPWSRPNGIADFSLASAIHRHVVTVLEYTHGDLQWAADELGVDAVTLYRLRRSWQTGTPARLSIVRLGATPPGRGPASVTPLAVAAGGEAR